MNHLKTFQRLAVVVLLLMVGFSSRLSAQTCPTSNELTITVIPEATISTAGATTICAGGNATLTATPVGGTGTCTIQWQNSSDGITWANIPGETNATLNITALGATMNYRATYTCTGSGCDVATSNSQTVTVNPDLSFTANLSNITQCIGGTTQLTVTTTGGSGSALTYTWEQSSDNSTWGAAASATNANTYTPSSATAGTMYYRVRVSDAISGCDEAISAVSTVVITPDLSITANLNNITECIGGTTQLTVTTTGGSGGALTYTWEESSDNSTWGAAASATNANTYTPSSATAGTMYYRVRISDAANGCDAITSAVSTVTINPDISISAQPVAITECVDGNLQMSVTASGGVGTLTYQWESSADGTTWADVSGATNASYTPPSTTPGVTHYRVRINNTGNGCQSITSTSATATIVAKPTIAIAASTSTICVGGGVELTATPANGTGTCTIQWQNSTNSGTTWNDIPGANGTTYTTPALNSNTTYRARYSCTGNGCCN